MSLERAIYYQKYIGLSSDDKPVYNEEFTLSLMPGAEFYEIDTGDTYLWDGDAWKRQSKASQQYALRLENTNAPPTKITYIGEAAPGSGEDDAVWRIKKITETDHAGFDADITVEWCLGSDSFTNLWNGHAGFSYS